uniref:Bifunctional inhibitor/plant lipid transfer protein/seed storage helical domain-containing protein n=1 Tax=Leersia perrieri TaxID=77586 RepID=A0A0D9XHT1_9ORYZ
MSHLNSASLAEMLILLAVITFTAAPAAASPAQAPAGSDCPNDITGLMTTCYKFVTKDGPMLQPSPDCCAIMEEVNVPCVCSYLGSPGVKDNISLDKVFYVTKQCGISIPGNCGGSMKV